MAIWQFVSCIRCCSSNFRNTIIYELHQLWRFSELILEFSKHVTRRILNALSVFSESESGRVSSITDDIHIPKDTQIFVLDIIVKYFILVMHCYLILYYIIIIEYYDIGCFLWCKVFFYDAAKFQCAVFTYRLIGSTSIIYTCLVNILSWFFCIWFDKIKIESIKLCVIAPSNRNS